MHWLNLTPPFRHSRNIANWCLWMDIIAQLLFVGRCLVVVRDIHLMVVRRFVHMRVFYDSCNMCILYVPVCDTTVKCNRPQHYYELGEYCLFSTSAILVRLFYIFFAFSGCGFDVTSLFYSLMGMGWAPTWLTTIRQETIIETHGWNSIAYCIF